MHNDEQIFDYMAAAEETGKQLDEMVRRIPVEIKAVLAEEWRNSAWLADLPKVAEKAMAATGKTKAVVNQAEIATRFLTRTVKRAGLVICLASLVVPLLTWVVTNWKLDKIEAERERLAQEVKELGVASDALQTDYRKKREAWVNEIKELSAKAGKLQAAIDEGAELLIQSDGTHIFTLPRGRTFEKDVTMRDGRGAIIYR